MAVLIPLSLYICADDSIGMGAVLLTRLMVIVCMNFVQKESVASFPVWFLLGYQMALQVVLIGAYNFRNLKVGKYSDLVSWLLWMTPFWVAQLITSLYAFKAASVSAIQIIRSVLPLMSFAMEKTLYNDPKNVGAPLIMSMVLVIVGTTLYGYSSASVTAEALMWIFVNSVFTVVATVFRSKFMKDKSFTVSTPLCMCSVSSTAVPFICVAAFLTGETQQWPGVIASTSTTAWFWATMSGLVAGCFSFLQFRCQKKLSGTSDLMFQNAVKVFIIIMGMVAFGDSFNIESLFACVLALGGCAWYGTLRKAEVSGGTKGQVSDMKQPLMKTDADKGGWTAENSMIVRFKIGFAEMLGLASGKKVGVGNGVAPARAASVA
jgi:drug/metabolite transporter (DMT)-like permease